MAMRSLEVTEINYLDCGDGFIGAHRSNSKLYTTYTYAVY